MLFCRVARSCLLMPQLPKAVTKEHVTRPKSTATLSPPSKPSKTSLGNSRSATTAFPDPEVVPVTDGRPQQQFGWPATCFGSDRKPHEERLLCCTMLSKDGLRVRSACCSWCGLAVKADNSLVAALCIQSNQDK